MACIASSALMICGTRLLSWSAMTPTSTAKLGNEDPGPDLRSLPQMSPSGTADTGALRLRGARPGDEPGIKRVVGAVLSEFGFAEDANGLDADLHDVYANYEAPGGSFLVLVDTKDTIL